MEKFAIRVHDRGLTYQADLSFPASPTAARNCADRAIRNPELSSPEDHPGTPSRLRPWSQLVRGGGRGPTLPAFHAAPRSKDSETFGGGCQDSCRVSGARSGFKTTDPTGRQLRVAPLHRSGLARRMRSYSSWRLARTVRSC